MRTGLRDGVGGHNWEHIIVCSVNRLYFVPSLQALGSGILAGEAFFSRIREVIMRVKWQWWAKVLTSCLGRPRRYRFSQNINNPLMPNTEEMADAYRRSTCSVANALKTCQKHKYRECRSIYVLWGVVPAGLYPPPTFSRHSVVGLEHSSLNLAAITSSSHYIQHDISSICYIEHIEEIWLS